MTHTALHAAEAIAVAALEQLPQTILVSTGRALYSPIDTLVSGSPVYFMGLNPGEAPASTEAHSHLTVHADLARLQSGQIKEHAYLDERWKNYPVGGAPIQVAAQQVFAILAAGDLAAGIQLLRRTPASNFVLSRSSSELMLAQRTESRPVELAQQCWAFHQAVIAECKCEIVLTHAVGIARAFARAQGLGEGAQRPSGWGGTLSTLYAWRLREGPCLLALPNLSRYKPDGARREALHAFFQEFGPSRAHVA